MSDTPDTDVTSVLAKGDPAERIAAYADATILASQKEDGVLVLTIDGARWLAENATEELWLEAIAAAQVRAGLPEDQEAKVATLISIGAGYFLQMSDEGMETIFDADLHADLVGAMEEGGQEAA